MTRPFAAVAAFFAAVATVATSFSAPAPMPIGYLTTAADFAGPGTQPGSLNLSIVPSTGCKFCHGNYDEDVEPYSLWSTSLMAQSARDPMFWACLTVSEQEVPGVGASCLRCHTPGGFLEGNVTAPGGTDGSLLTDEDFDGVTCNVCHRMVDPIASPANPAADTAILAALSGAGNLPTDAHNGYYVIDPDDVRRGPFDLGQFFNWHQVAESPYHRESLLCATCHDNSNALYTRVGGPTPSPSDTYVLNALGQPSTASKQDQFPQQRTYSEWSESAFAQGPINLKGKFGGEKQNVASCQDCHMPDANDIACEPSFSPVLRPDMPLHHLHGANTWVLDAVLALDAETDPAKRLYPTSANSQLTPASVANANKRTGRMLRDAAEMDVEVDVNGDLSVRVWNDSGHKLPTGFVEGRRIWLNVQYLDANCNVVDERGGYDLVNATLDEVSTKVYEIELGLDAAAAAASGAPAGEGQHYMLSNVIEKDNRIPPRGFTNAGFEAVQAHPVGATYADGQHWDDTIYSIPAGAVSARVRLYYQTTAKEWVEFLRDSNTTDARGQIAYDLWESTGKSEPFLMEERTIALDEPSFTIDWPELSVSQGGLVRMRTNAGVANAGNLYWVVGSVSGTEPGLPVGALTLPLVWDTYTQQTVFAPNTNPLVNSFGTLNGQGRAVTGFKGTVNQLAGFAEIVLHHAVVVIDPSDPALVTWISCPVRLELRP
jgi:hypothetical protein